MSHRGRKQTRRGVASVEFALTAPLLFFFTFAGIEFSRVNMIRNTAENAAYEGARRGIVPGATAGDCQAKAQELIDLVQIQSSSIQVSPANIQPDSPTVTVTVDVPLTPANGYVTPQFYLGRTVRATITLPRETG